MSFSIGTKQVTLVEFGERCVARLRDEYAAAKWWELFKRMALKRSIASQQRQLEIFRELERCN